MGYIPQRALEKLKDYRYKGTDKSLVSNYILNPFWTWFVTLWPTWIAPNAITLSGLAIVCVNFATMLYLDPEYQVLKGGVVIPQWIYLTWGIGLFLYQTFDAIDGKQARRTGMAGPLGEMFDHGCDAINTTLEVILASQALNLGRSWWTVASQIGTLANFYLTTWEEYHTGEWSLYLISYPCSEISGVLYLGHFSGPVEGILMICSIYVISSIFGSSFWDQRILTVSGLENNETITALVPNVGINETFMFFAGWGLAFNILSSYWNVYQSCRAKDTSTLKPLLYLLPFPVSAALQVLWMNNPSLSDSHILKSRVFVPFLCSWGLQFAHQVGRMILAHVTGQPFPWWDSMWLWSIVAAIDANLPYLIGREPLIQSSSRNTEMFIYLALAVSAVTYIRFVTLVINDITNFLGIACLTVRKRDTHGEWQDANPAREKKGR
ncbi:choline ethanolaminephosphotransferase [Vararia minispora EC-137]|uniref:Choline ethanolaminephosphotransferase n=1 Tax=Vararia minispora EC-137 TaxID=1314806 RepID=A0ACB8QCS1_9AGAM|nr:choline ethanolaminephosphotransferase [Vararia minispora EC-137]